MLLPVPGPTHRQRSPVDAREKGRLQPHTPETLARPYTRSFPQTEKTPDIEVTLDEFILAHGQRHSVHHGRKAWRCLTQSGSREECGSPPLSPVSFTPKSQPTERCSQILGRSSLLTEPSLKTLLGTPRCVSPWGQQAWSG